VSFAGITTANDIGDEMLSSSSIAQRKKPVAIFINFFVTICKNVHLNAILV
jgi:hypothetical protein